jgi:hypothetical protein
MGILQFPIALTKIGFRVQASLDNANKKHMKHLNSIETNMGRERRECMKTREKVRGGPRRFTKE